MDRTLGKWGRKCIGHWVNGVERKRTVRNRNRRKEEWGIVRWRKNITTE